MNSVNTYLRWLGLFCIPIGLFSQPDNCLSSVHTKEDDSTNVFIRLELAQQTYSKDYKESLDYALDALEFARLSGKPDLLFKVNNYLGIILMDQGSYGLSAQFFNEALKNTVEAQDFRNQFRVQYNLASLSIKLDEYGHARELIEDADIILDSIFPQYSDYRLGDLPYDFEYYSIRASIGMLHLGIKDFDSAINEFHKLLRLSQSKTNYFENELPVYWGLAEANYYQMNFQEALQFYAKGVDIATSLNDTLYLIDNFVGLGKCNAKLGKLTEAMNDFNRALELSKENDFVKHFVEITLEMAKLQIAQRNYEEALFHSMSSKNKSIQSNSILFQIESQKLLAQIYSHFGNADSTFYYLKQVEDLKLDMEEKEAIRKITEARVASIFEEREKALHGIYQGRVGLLRGVVFLLSSGLIIVIIFSLIFYFYNTQSIRDEKMELLNEKEQVKATLERNEKLLVKNSLIQLHEEKLMDETLKNDEEIKLNELLKNIKNKKLNQNSFWDEFEIRNMSLFSPFFNKLLNLHPNLTNNERRLCSFLILDLSTKEISRITGQSVESINVARVRLRKKLNLTHKKINFSIYFQEIMES